MRNLDNQKTLNEAKAVLATALRDGTEEEQQIAFSGLFDAINAEVQAEARKTIGVVNSEYQDEQILMNRGTRKPLTSEEKRYFNAVIEKKGFENVDQALPETIVTDVLNKIETEHPLLSRIDTQTINANFKALFAKPNTKLAFWGEICSDIRQIILDGFKVVDMQVSKLSGFVVLCKGYEELGADWLATYVTRSLYEIISASLEEAIVNGDGDKKPLGMTKSVFGAVDGVHQDKEAVKLTDVDAISLGGIRATLAKTRNDNGQVSVLVNPVTYWTKLFPLLATKNSEGRFVLSNLPTGDEIVPSYAVAENKLIIGNLNNYFLGVASQVNITKYTETLAIEDLNLYIAKLFANGTPKDKDSFIVADVAGVKGATAVPVDVEPEVVEGA